jgi:hypothetical protein
MAIQPFGVKVREKKEVPKKKRKISVSQIVSIILSIAILLSSAYYANQNNNLQKSNANLQNLLYNYTPLIFSNYSDTSTLQNVFYSSEGLSSTYFEGLVSVNLKVVSPYDGLLTLTPKSFNFSYGSSDSLNPYYFDVSLSNYTTVSFFPTVSNTEYQYFISKNVMNPIQDKLWVQVDTYLNATNLSYVFRNQGENTVTSVGFPLGTITFQATLFEAQIDKNYTQDFTEGVICNINCNP